MFSPTCQPNFDDNSLKIKPKNDKIDWLIIWSIMYIVNGAEPQ